MRHRIFEFIGPIGNASDEVLENAVSDLIIHAAEAADGGYVEDRATRAEALAILGHELRRRQKSA